jgi:sulfate transport system permease protein
LPLQIEILYNEYNFTAAFAAATLLTFLALITLVIKRAVEAAQHRSQVERAGQGSLMKEPV